MFVSLAMLCAMLGQKNERLGSGAEKGPFARHVETDPNILGWREERGQGHLLAHSRMRTALFAFS